MTPDVRDRYLDLLKRCLTRTEFPEATRPIAPQGLFARPLYRAAASWLAGHGLRVVGASVDPMVRADGRDWPLEAETMIGWQRLDHLDRCCRDVLARVVPGDFLEAGVWRGGASILMRGVLAAYGVRDRVVWAADSFQGLPKPDAARYPADAGDRHWTRAELAVPLDAVKANFTRYDLLDDQVRFLVGWFADTLPSAPIERLAVLRLDGDMYSSTTETLEACYPKVSIGGYVIVDDYGAVPGCRAAVEDFRAKHSLTEPLERVDWTGACWQRQRA